MLLFLLIFILLYAVPVKAQSFNCSAFAINNEKILLGKNLDWALGNGIIVLNPSSAEKHSIASSKSWSSIYRSITFNHLGNNLPLGGMNEAGLVIEELSTWPVDYPKTDSMNCLNEFEWIQYNLDNYSTVAQVISNIGLLGIDKFAFGLHYIVADSTGDAAVIEFTKGSPQIYNGKSLPYIALTNNNYLELVNYLNYFDQSNRTNVDISQSQERFVKLVGLMENNYINNYNTAMGLLDSVRVSDTRWSVVYDIREKKIYYKTDISKNIDSISFHDINTDQSFPSYIPINNSYSEFKELTDKENNHYLFELINSLQRLKNEDGSDLANKVRHLIKPKI